MIELRWASWDKKTRVPKTSPGGQPLAGGGSREVTKTVRALQYRRCTDSGHPTTEWENIPEVRLGFPDPEDE